MITIDGSRGEGGGQILRTSLALSLVTGEAVRIERIRAKRERPGLQRQHLTAVQAAARVGAAEVEGSELGSSQLFFRPGAVQPGRFHFSIGTAGSVTLVAQTILPALLLATCPSDIVPSEVVIEGGTHNPLAPPFEFLERAFLPLLARMGARVEARLERHGFFPAGGGRVRLSVVPVARLAPIEIHERGALLRRRARALVAGLPRDIAERELAVVRKKLEWGASECEIIDLGDESGPANVLALEVEHAQATEVVTALGRRGRRAEEVARGAAEELARHLASGAPIGTHLADQLLLPLALAGSGSFMTCEPSLHTLTNIDVIERFLPVRIIVSRASEGLARIDVRPHRPV